jgi:serine/threonine-protein kinase HipA
MTNKIKRCPITYEEIVGNEYYSSRGLYLLSPSLRQLDTFPYTIKEQLLEARQRAEKISIQGVQPKLSAILDLKKNRFVVADRDGTFILKPQNPFYEQLPENEDLSMKLASLVIETPLHGMIYCADHSLTYFIRRFDRDKRNKKKLPLEDFTQLAQVSRNNKYDYSMEKLAKLVDLYCSFPLIEKTKLLYRVLLNYLIGNEDMHLKNFSLLTVANVIQLAPAYDFVNTTIVMPVVKEEIALPLHGKKNNLTKKDIIDYYGYQCLQLPPSVINKILRDFTKILPECESIIKISFLNEVFKKKYLNLFLSRATKLEL